MSEETQDQSEVTQEATQATEKSTPKVETMSVVEKREELENNKDIDLLETIKTLQDRIDKLSEKDKAQTILVVQDEAKQYCSHRDKDFNYDLTIQKYKELATQNPRMQKEYGNSIPAMFAFWQDYVKNDESIVESRKPQVPAKLDELSKKISGGVSLSVDEQNEYMKMLIEN